MRKDMAPVDPKLKAYVLELLENYSETTVQIDLLHYELEHLIEISEDEMIDAMNYGRNESGISPPSGISNKTMSIALNYQDRLEKLNREAADDIIRRLLPLESERRRLLFYISHLGKRYSDVINAVYLEQKPLEHYAKVAGVTSRTVQNLRRQAVDELCRMYEYTLGAR